MHLVDNSEKAQFSFRLPFQSISFAFSVSAFPQHALESFDKVNISIGILITFLLLISCRHMPVPSEAQMVMGY